MAPSLAQNPNHKSLMDMDRADQRALNVLASKGLTNSDIQSLRRTWNVSKKPGESLIDFLVRINVLRDDAPDLLAMNWGDELLLTGAADLFRSRGFDTLWSLLSGTTTLQPGENHTRTPADRFLLGEEQLQCQIIQTPVLRKPRPADDTQSSIMARIGEEASSGIVSGPCSEIVRAVTSDEPPPPPSANLASGHLLGRCLITGRIAEGSYGAVYRALHRTLNIPVAVKVLHPELLDGDTKAGQQFRSEAMLLARLNHPNIVRLWDFDDSVAPPYLVLEFIEGSTVADLIQRRSSLRVELAMRIILQVVDGLDAAYKIGIIHRDIKPANILITRDEKAKIADLGLATVMDIGRQLGHAPASHESPLAGTVAYLAPEQAGKSASFDHRSDVYSLGATFYHMVTGRLPFNGKSSLEVLLKHAREKLTPPNEIDPTIDRGVSELIVKMMAKDPSHRFRNYEDLRDALIDVDIAMQSHISGLNDDFRRG